nr:CD209 antigen-like protein B [Misgurnus anguillicaudatus]
MKIPEMQVIDTEYGEEEMNVYANTEDMNTYDDCMMSGTENFDTKRKHTDGWIYYQSSLYINSSEWKNWTESRRYCRGKGADLIIINNYDEQDFITKNYGEGGHWIGLPDSDDMVRWESGNDSPLNSTIIDKKIGNLNIPEMQVIDKEDGKEEMNVYEKLNIEELNTYDVCMMSGTENSDTKRKQTSQHTGSENVRMRSYRSVTVCLVLLCVLLLTAVIVLCVLINTNNQQFNIKNKNITEERDQLLTKYTNITEERDQLLTKYTNITEKRDQLLTKYTNITKERDQLLTKYTNIKEERDQQRDQLTQYINVLMKILKAERWMEYQSSLYFISSEKKSWYESRGYCRKRGADLIIINNKEEQGLIKKISGTTRFWIGLSDSYKEGTWKWVDGSTLTTKFWGSGEPNSYSSDEDCVETGSSDWNDQSCNSNRNWICEIKK